MAAKQAAPMDYLNPSLALTRDKKQSKAASIREPGTPGSLKPSRLSWKNQGAGKTGESNVCVRSSEQILETHSLRVIHN